MSSKRELKWKENVSAFAKAFFFRPVITLLLLFVQIEKDEGY